MGLMVCCRCKLPMYWYNVSFHLCICRLGYRTCSGHQVDESVQHSLWTPDEILFQKDKEGQRLWSGFCTWKERWENWSTQCFVCSKTMVNVECLQWSFIFNTTLCDDLEELSSIQSSDAALYEPFRVLLKTAYCKTSSWRATKMRETASASKPIVEGLNFKGGDRAITHHSPLKARQWQTLKEVGCFHSKMDCR